MSEQQHEHRARIGMAPGAVLDGRAISRALDPVPWSFGLGPEERQRPGRAPDGIASMHHVMGYRAANLRVDLSATSLRKKCALSAQHGTIVRYAMLCDLAKGRSLNRGEYQ